jgi:hypothetical protein
MTFVVLSLLSSIASKSVRVSSNLVIVEAGCRLIKKGSSWKIPENEYHTP